MVRFLSIKLKVRVPSDGVQKAPLGNILAPGHIEYFKLKAFEK